MFYATNFNQFHQHHMISNILSWISQKYHFQNTAAIYQFYLIYHCIIIIMSQIKQTHVEAHVLKKFKLLKKIGSGAYGHVWKVQEKGTQKILALKKIFDAFQHSTDAQRTYREIQILLQIDHPNIVKLYETIPAQNNKDVYLVFQYMQSDLHNAIGDNIMKDAHFKFIIYQIAKSLKYLHSGMILHRDLKPSNILVNSDCKIKLCDFGLVRSLVNANENNQVLTQGVATRWYRAPQVLLGSKCYSTPADVWSFGCIIYEMIQRKPLFAGNSTMDQLQKIIAFTGIPSESDIESIESQVAQSMIREIKNVHSNKIAILKSLPIQYQNILTKILQFNPKKRITVEQILKHPLVKSFRKQSEQIVAQKDIKMSIDDNCKLSVQQYRKLIYHPKHMLKQPLVINQQPKKKLGSTIIEDHTKNGKNSIATTIKKIRSAKDIMEKVQSQIYQNQKIETKPSTFQTINRTSWKQIANSPQNALKNSSNKFIPTTNKYSIKKSQQNSQAQTNNNSNLPKSTELIPEKNQYIHKKQISTTYSPKNYMQIKKKAIVSNNQLWNSPKNKQDPEQKPPAFTKTVYSPSYKLKTSNNNIK